MNQPARHFALGVSTGATVFALVVPLIHLLAALAALVGVDFGRWDSPVGVFIFTMTTIIVGVPWGLWITFTDARQRDLFDHDQDVVVYQIAALCLLVSLTILTVTWLQPVYERNPWLFTPGLFVCGSGLIGWRWRKVWRFRTSGGVRGLLARALAARDDS